MVRVDQRIREFFDAWLARDLDAATALFTPDVMFHQPPDALEGGDREGIDAMRAVLEGLLYQFEYEAIDIHEVVVGPRGTLARFTARGRGRLSGVPIEQEITHVYEFRNGLISRLAWFFTRDEGAERAGL